MSGKGSTHTTSSGATRGTNSAGNSYSSNYTSSSGGVSYRYDNASSGGGYHYANSNGSTYTMSAGGKGTYSSGKKG